MESGQEVMVQFKVVFVVVVFNEKCLHQDEHTNAFHIKSCYSFILVPHSLKRKKAVQGKQVFLNRQGFIINFTTATEHRNICFIYIIQQIQLLVNMRAF